MYLIPLDRVVQITPQSKPDEIKKKYILSFCDELSSTEQSAQLQSSYEKFEQRLAQIKSKGV